MTLSSHKQGSSPAVMLAAVSIAFLGLAQQADAALTINFSQSGADVVVTASGSVDLGGAVFYNAFRFDESRVSGGPTRSVVWSGLMAGDDVYLLGGGSAVRWIGNGGLPDLYGIATGDAFGFLEDGTASYLYLESGSLGGEVSGSLTLADLDLGSLGLRNTTSSWGPGVDQAVHITSGPVPEPSSFALLALGSIGLVARRKR